ncbi:MAG: radical SAM protein [Planctomycetes bacterium]|nr:radical SAM protein [Planctomycetota bacterium]
MSYRSKLANKIALDRDLELHRERFAGRPEIVVFQTTEYCNLRCVMCPRSVQQGTRRLSASEIERIASQLFPFARLAILAGHEGEPLLHDFDVVVRAARRFGVKLDVVTNATQLTLPRYLAWRDVLTRINVSLDSPVPHIYAALRVGSELRLLEHQLAQIRDWRRKRPDDVIWTVSAVVMRSNLATIAELPDWAAHFGFHAVMLQPLRQFSKQSPGEDLLPDDFVARADRAGAAPAFRLRDDVLATLARVSAAGVRHGVSVYFSDFALPPVEVRPPPPALVAHLEAQRACWFLARSIVVAPNGVVTPCCHPTPFVFGNLLTQELEEVWNGTVARGLRRAHFERTRVAPCARCLHAPYLRTRDAQLSPALA